MNCEFCHRTFTTAGNLKKHQSTTISCLKAQNNPITEYQKTICEFCNKTISVSHISRHHKHCEHKIKIETQTKLENSKKELEKKFKEEIEKLKLENKNLIEQLNREKKDFKESLERLASRPTTAVTNNIRVQRLSPFILKPDEVKQTVDRHFTYDYFIDGQVGIANFTVDYILPDNDGKSRYVCIDPNRQIFAYKDRHGKVNKDVRSKQLIKALKDIKNKSKQIYEVRTRTDTDVGRLCVYNTTLAEILQMYDNKYLKFVKELVSLTLNDSLLGEESEDEEEDDDVVPNMLLLEDESNSVDPPSLENDVPPLLENDDPQSLENDDDDKRKDESTLEELQEEELRESEEKALFESECDEEYDVDSDIIVSDDENIEIAIEKSDSRKRIRMSVKNYSDRIDRDELKKKFDKIRNFDEEYENKKYKEFVVSSGGEDRFTKNRIKEIEETKKLHAEYRNGTLDLSALF